MHSSPLPRAQTLAIAALPLLMIACALVPWLTPSSTPREIELTNEAVLATNAAIETAVVGTATAEARQAASQRLTETAQPRATHTPTPPGGLTLTSTPTMDPCTGWWCAVSGVVYAEAALPGNELGGATVTLGQGSYCSPTRGEVQTESGPDGAFEFGEVFFHDTDRVWIEVEAQGYELARWDSVDRYCLYCSCFGSPIEFVLGAPPGQ